VPQNRIPRRRQHALQQAEADGEVIQREKPLEMTLSGFHTDAAARLVGRVDNAEVAVSIEMHKAM